MKYENLIIDCFAGGGGASVGIEMATGRQVDIAINHDPDAILMHKTNHPDTLHLTEDIFDVDLKKYVKDRHVALMWASPDCTSHSKAKGGKPREKGLRILPWAVFKHAKATAPDVIVMENVEEIQQWGPLDENGYPIKEKKGEEYERFISAMKSIGYAFDCRELVAADFGAPTTRKRWYAIFRRDGKDIVWPEPTHNKNGTDGLKKWVPISTCLDFTDLGKSIFGRKKPLAENTLKRIARGLRKFVFENPEPFIVQVNHSGEGFRGQDIHGPMPTITQKHGFGKVSPVMFPMIDKAYGGNYAGGGSAADDPLHTITVVDHNRLVTPVVAPCMLRNNTGAPGSDVKDPILTITTGGHHGMINPFIMQLGHTGFTKDRNRSVEDPMSTVVTKNEHCCVSPVMMDYHLGASEEMVMEQDDKYAQVASFLTKFYKSGTGQGMEEPIHTITCSPGHFGQVSILAVNKEELLASGVTEEVAQKCTWVSEFMIEYYGCGTGSKVTDPMHTVVTKDRFALITVLGNDFVILDIYLRMLTPEELKLGQGFPEDYIIDHDYNQKKYPVSKQVARIGNSVVPIMAQKLVEANCAYLKVGERQPNLRMKDIYEDNGQLRFA